MFAYCAPDTPPCCVLQLLLNPGGALQCACTSYLLEFNSIPIAITTATRASDAVTTAILADLVDYWYILAAY